MKILQLGAYGPWLTIVGQIERIHHRKTDLVRPCLGADLLYLLREHEARAVLYDDLPGFQTGL